MTMIRVRVRVPIESTTIIAASGDVVEVVVDENGQRWAEMLPDDARLMLNSGLPESLPWRDANPHLVSMLGPVPKQQPGVPWAHLQQFAEDARPIHWSDRGRIASQAIEALRRARR
jgi:hypothetical protein